MPSREHDHGPTVVYSKAEVENDEGSTQKTEILQSVLKEGKRWEMSQRGSNRWGLMLLMFMYVPFCKFIT